VLLRLWYCQRTFCNAPDLDLQYNVGEKLRNKHQYSDC